MLLAIVTAALTAMQIYYKRSIQAVVKVAADDLGQQKPGAWDYDYRFEWSPLISFVFFKWQTAVMFVAPEADHYWECWLYYTRETDKKKSVEERIAQCRKFAPCTWSRHTDGETSVIDYYDVILKDKYVNKR